MEVFPDDIILQVFSYLPQKTLCLGARLVCKRWWDISKDATLWKELVIPIHFTDDRFLLLMHQVGIQVEELDCTMCEVLSSGVFMRLNVRSSTFPNLKRLSLPIEPANEPKINDINSYFNSLSSTFPNLTSLENISSTSTELCVDILHCQSYFPHTTVVHDNATASYGRISEVLQRRNAEKKEKWKVNICAVSKSCPQVSEYKCTKGGGYIDEYGLEVIGNAFKKLKSLELRLCSISDRAVEQFYIDGSKDIQELLLEKPGKLSDKGLATIASNSPALKKIKLSRCSDITREGIKSLVSKCHKINSLHINNSKGWGNDPTGKEPDQIDDECIHDIVTNCKSLEIFRILYTRKLTDKGIRSLQVNSNNIRALMFFDCPGIGDEAVKEMAKIRSLKRLVLVSTNVTPKGILNFILDAPCLKALTLYCDPSDFSSDMTELGEEIYEKIDANESKFRPNTLRNITIRGVGGAFIQLITVLSPNLLCLDVRDSKSYISTMSLKTVLVNCEYLETFDISSFASIDTSFLNALSKTANSLRKLSLGSNVKLCNTESFTSIIQNCPCLEMIAMDTYESDINEDKLVCTIKEHHGGYCYMHVDPECSRDPEFKNRFISLHFTALIYVGSICKLANKI